MTTFHDAHREQVATVDVPRVHSDKIDFTAVVDGPHVARRSRPISTNVHDDEALSMVNPAPLALHPVDAFADLETDVVPAVFSDRLQDGYAEPRCCELDLELGYRTFYVRRLHERMFA